MTDLRATRHLIAAAWALCHLCISSNCSSSRYPKRRKTDEWKGSLIKFDIPPFSIAVFNTRIPARCPLRAIGRVTAASIMGLITTSHVLQMIGCPRGGKTGKAQNEQMFSGLPPIADIAATCRHVADGPQADIDLLTRSPRLKPAAGLKCSTGLTP
jgi:hypothetical protein